MYIEAENETPENEEEVQPNEQTEAVEVNEDLTKAQQVAENQKIRAEKAEKELKDLKGKVETETPKKETKSNEPDYAKLAYLNGEKVVNSDDQKMVMDEAERLKLPLTDILAMKHIKAQLKDAKDQRSAEDGSPKGKGKSGGSGQQDVDYYLAKGTTPSDPDLANKVINARMQKETNSSKFSEELYPGQE